MPCGDAVGAEEGDVAAQGRQPGDRLGADAGLGEPADPSAEQVDGDPVHRGEEAGGRHGVGDHGADGARLQERGDPSDGGAGVQDHRTARGGRKVGERGLGDPLLLRGEGGFPVSEGRLDQGQPLGHHRAAVDAPQDAPPVEGLEVASDGLGGHLEPLSEFGDHDPVGLEGQFDDGLLPFLRVHHTSMPAPPDVAMYCFTTVWLVLARGKRKLMWFCLA